LAFIAAIMSLPIASPIFAMLSPYLRRLPAYQAAVIARRLAAHGTKIDAYDS
jgi:hypothetical protein